MLTVVPVAVHVEEGANLALVPVHALTPDRTVGLAVAHFQDLCLAHRPQGSREATFPPKDFLTITLN